ncbi:endo-1,4-beta-xylanase [Segetibacter koreensis]|uniref:endo-1,4-beta-xylanase n=1 Tax=Segetibacter koreensis TaxID=398037 RepID=UPI00036942C9|nr:endo-1,4-beta-xylanase [Segetibacter koreensis]
MNAQKGWLIAAVLLLLCSSSYSQKPIRSNITSAKGLKDYYQDYFPIGVAVAPRMLHGDDSALILSQFNSLTAENAMKMGPIHPREHEYYWKDADSIATFAKKHGMRLRGHNLCWHSQAPSWMFVNEKGDTVSKQVLLQRLKEHITTVVNRYKDVIYGWDVVNEAIDDRDSVFYRQSAWYKICGEDFIAKAFEYAHAADPKAVLFYNDYNTENPKKREKIYQTVRKLKEAGVAIHGVGLQGHWSLNNPSREELEKSIQMFSSLGLQVQVTEMDVSVYAGRQGGQLIQNQNQAAATFTGDMEQQQRDKYKMVFDVLRENKGKISGVTFWNVSDSYSWLDGRGRKNYPLLFDMNRQPKKAYWDVVNFVETK